MVYSGRHIPPGSPGITPEGVILSLMSATIVLQVAPIPADDTAAPALNTDHETKNWDAGIPCCLAFTCFDLPPSISPNVRAELPRFVCGQRLT